MTNLKLPSSIKAALELQVPKSIDNLIPEDTLLPEDEFLPEVELVGNPNSDIENWHEQTYPDTCAIVSQEFILDELTGMDFTEEQLRQEAINKGYYSPGYGTPQEDVGRLLEDYGFEVERTQGNTLEDLSVKLENGDKVLVSLDADEIWNLGQEDYQEDYLDDYSESSGCIPGQDCNHAVQVIGIDYSDRNNPMVILNDPGSPNSQGTIDISKI